MKLIRTTTIKAANTGSKEVVNLLRDIEGYHVQFRDYLTPCDLVDGRIVLCDALYGLQWNIEAAVVNALNAGANLIEPSVDNEETLASLLFATADVVNGGQVNTEPYELEDGMSNHERPF